MRREREAAKPAGPVRVSRQSARGILLRIHQEKTNNSPYKRPDQVLERLEQLIAYYADPNQPPRLPPLRWNGRKWVLRPGRE